MAEPDERAAIAAAVAADVDAAVRSNDARWAWASSSEAGTDALRWVGEKFMLRRASVMAATECGLACVMTGCEAAELGRSSGKGDS